MIRDGFLRFCDDPEIACIRAEKELEHLRDEISRIREENRWISMNERWPEENQRCLIYPIDDEAEVAYLKNGKLKKVRVRKDDTTRNNPMLRTTTNARQS